MRPCYPPPFPPPGNVPYSRERSTQEVIEQKYGLPPALPLVVNGRLLPAYPVFVGHGGDDLYLFSAKYIGEINQIYDLLLKIGTHQAIDPDNPLPYEFKIEDDILYVRDENNTKWVEMGNVSKPLLGAEEEIDKCVTSVTASQGIITIKTHGGTTTSFPMNIDETYLHDIEIENGYLKVTRGNGQLHTIMLGIDVTYPKDVKFENGKLVITRGNGEKVEINMNYVASVVDQNGVIKVTDSKNVSENILVPITSEEIDSIIDSIWTD